MASGRLCFSSPLTVARVAAVIDLHKHSGKETTKTEKLLEAIKKVEPVPSKTDGHRASDGASRLPSGSPTMPPTLG